MHNYLDKITGDTDMTIAEGIEAGLASLTTERVRSIAAQQKAIVAIGADRQGIDVTLMALAIAELRNRGEVA